MTWIHATNLTDLPENQLKVIRHGHKQVCLLRKPTRLFAFDNRCPHEGYPLAQGQVDGACILTCHWHNWKFRLEDGENLLGEDRLRTYPVRLEGDQVMLDLSDPPPESRLPELRRNFLDAFKDRQYGRMARLLTQYHLIGLDPKSAIIDAIEFSYQRFEYGTTHALAAAADWLALYERFAEEPEQGLIYLLEIADHLAYDSLRLPEFPFSEAVETYQAESLLAALAREDEAAAIAQINGALEQGLDFMALEDLLAQAALRHYAGYGHAVIYVRHAGRLIEALGADITPFVLKPLIRYLCTTRKEDKLPEFRAYHQYHKEMVRPSTTAGETDASFPLNAAINPAMAWTVANYHREGATATYATLLSAIAKRLLYFDADGARNHRRSIPSSYDWLDITHALTFANSARAFAERDERLWPSVLLQMACFLGRTQAFANHGQDMSRWLVADWSTLEKRVIAVLGDHGFNNPIFSCHLLKTAYAGRAEAAQADEDTAATILAAVNRLIHSGIKEKRPIQTIHQALQVVGRDFGYKPSR